MIRFDKYRYCRTIEEMDTISERKTLLTLPNKPAHIVNISST